MTHVGGRKCRVIPHVEFEGRGRHPNGNMNTQEMKIRDRRWSDTNRTGRITQGNTNMDKKFHFMKEDLEICICFVLGHFLIKRTVLRWSRNTMLMFYFMNPSPNKITKSFCIKKLCWFWWQNYLLSHENSRCER